MMKEREEIVISNSHNRLRIICFVLAVVLAVGAFSFGFTRLGHKDPGYYEIDAAEAEEAPMYSLGFTLIYYFEGDSDSIKAKLNAVTDLYSAALLRSYKLLDAETTYDGFVNLATLNQNLGKDMLVSEELLYILEDAWAKTQEQRGFNMFAGALYQEWNSILSLDDIAEFDPVTNPDAAARIRELAERTRELDSFDMQIVDESARSIQINVSREYLDFLEQKEYDGTVLSLNLLSDAYRLDLVRNALEAQGFTNGYLYTDSGLTLSLSGHSDGAYAMYGFDGTQVVQCASIDAKANSACSFFRVFPLQEGEIMYHAVSSDTDVRYYHPCFITATGEFADLISSSCTVRYDGDIVESCYANLILFNQESREQLSAAASGETTFLCSLQGDASATLYTNNASVVHGAEGVQVKPFV